MNARAPSTPIDSIGGSSISAIVSSITCTSGFELADDAVVDDPTGGPVEREAEVVALDHLVARRPVPADAARVGQEHLRLAGHVDAHVPRVGRGHQGEVGELVAVLHPPGLGEFGRLDRVEVVLAEVYEGVGDPVDVLLDRHHHVRQHRRAAGPGDHEQVREPRRHQAEVGDRPVGPLLLQRQTVAAGDVDADDRAGHRVEAGGEHDRVELEGLAGRVDAGLGDRRDRVLAQVDQANVGEVVGLVVVGVETGPLGADVVVGRAQRLGDLGVVHDRADLVVDEVAQRVVATRRWPGCR